MLKLPQNAKIVEKFKYVLIAALLVIVLGVVFGVVRVATDDTFLNFGIDFTGGATISITSEDKIEQSVQDEIIKWLEDDDNGNGYRVNGDIQETPADGQYIYEIRLSYERFGKTITDETAFNNGIFSEDTDDDLCGHLFLYLNDTLNLGLADDCITSGVAGATASGALINSAIWAIVVAIIVMLIYIVIRFTFESALAAVCALAHDVIIMLSLMSIFNITINSTFIAAVITIIGYSINATIVIFDRIRAQEKLTTATELTDTELANQSIMSTLNVTVLSALTTLIMVVVLLFFSVTEIQEFILPIIFGLIAGAISSTMIAPALWVKFKKVFKFVKADKKSDYKGALKQDS